MGTFMGTRYEQKRIEPDSLIGKKYGFLTILSVEAPGRYSRDYICNCKCDCGNTCTKTYGGLKIAPTASCGKCRNRNSTGIVGTRIGIFDVLSITEGNISQNLKFKCKCVECGEELIYSFRHLDKIKKGLVTAKCNGFHRKSSGVPGISWSKNRNKWYVYIYYNGKQYSLGATESFEYAKELISSARKAKENNDFEAFYINLKQK